MKHTYSSIFFLLSFLLNTGLFAQISYTFTSAGASGATGPTQGQLDAEYLGTNLQGAVTSTSGIQTWTVPSSGLYSIECRGAQGYGPFGGRGASMLGEFLLTAGDVLKIVVGQQGAAFSGSGTNQYGGGGGSFVTDISNNPLVVAGGGGGSWITAYNSTTDASTSTSGNSGVSAAGAAAGGTGGLGGQSYISADGGGGLLGNGAGTSGGFAFVNGAGGGVATNGGNGGFGGGGGGSSWNNQRCGGGGGYSGGGGAYNSSSTGGNPQGGGGGSFNGGANPVNIAGVQLGDGEVIISPLSAPIPNEAGMGSIDSPNIPSCAGTYPLEVTVANFGNNQITSLNVQWTLNGGTVTTQAITSVLDTNGGSGSSTASVNLGNITFSGTTEIKVWTNLPNGVADTSNSNDTITTVFYASDPSLDLPNAAICDGNLAILDAGVEWASYQWSSGETSQQIAVLTAGTYSVTVIDTFNCPTSDEVTVTLSSKPTITLGENLSGCDDLILDAGNAGATFQWSSNETTQTIVVDQTGAYLVTVTTAAGCVNTSGVAVTIFDSPSIDLGEDFTICTDLFQSRLLSVVGSYLSYDWSNGSNQSSIIIDGNQGLPSGANTITLTVIDENGCLGTDEIVGTIRTCIPAGIDQMVGDATISVFPNPASDIINVTSSIPSSSLELEIIDVTGRTVLVSTTSETSISTIDVQHLNAGSYLLKVKTDNRVEFKTLIIK